MDITKRVAALVVLGSGLGGSVAGCVAQSPVVGENESAGGTGGSGNGNGGSGSGNGGGSVKLVGNTNYFVNPVIVPGPDEEQLCLPRNLPIDADGNVSCALYLATYVAGGGDCACDTGSVAQARPVVEQLLTSITKCGANTGVDCADYCICGVPQAEGDSAVDCLNNPNASDSSVGWCYVDPSLGRGSPELVSNCPPNQEQILRVLPEPTAASERDLYVLACVGGIVTPGETEPGPGELGASCIPSPERERNFNGFALTEVNLEFGAPDCQSGICVVNHFQGRASCPYGQNDPASSDEAPGCFVPDTDVSISVPVDPQLVERRAEDTVICSCRCDGPDPSASYCACPSDMECVELIRDIGVSISDPYEGSFCIPKGTRYDPLRPVTDPTECSVPHMNCGDAP